MSIRVILAIGVDSSLLETQSSAWKSSGFIVTFAWSIKDAITHFRYGDFDLVLLGHSLPAESRERLTSLIRASGSQVPVVLIGDCSSACDRFAEATFKVDPTRILEEIEELMVSQAMRPTSRANMSRSVTWQTTAR